MVGQRYAPVAVLPGERPVPIVQEAGLILGPIWTRAETLAPAGILSPDRLARSDSLYNTYSILNLKFGTKNTGEIMRDNNMKIHFK